MQKPVKLVSLAERKAQKSWNEYFGVLNFSELINEAEHIMSELDEKGLEGELLVRARHAMSEFYTRVEKESKGFAKAILGMKSDVEAALEKDLD